MWTAVCDLAVMLPVTGACVAGHHSCCHQLLIHLDTHTPPLINATGLRCELLAAGAVGVPSPQSWDLYDGRVGGKFEHTYSVFEVRRHGGW